MYWKVKLTIMRMGRSCSSCKQVFECDVKAVDAEGAVESAKNESGADQDTHKFQVNLVKRIDA